MYRVSTKGQVDKDDIPMQKTSCREFAERNGWTILKEFQEFVVVVKFPDMVNGGWKTERMYPGNRTAKPWEENEEGLPTMYKDCKVNLIDCGELE